MIHCGSRGYGHQVCSDYLRVMEHAVAKYKISLPDRELACAPGSSNEAQDYVQAMACAVNYAFCNRHAIMHWVRQSFQQVFHENPEKYGLKLVYDVATILPKLKPTTSTELKRRFGFTAKEPHALSQQGTRMFPADYRSEGQPVLIPGSMGTSSLGSGGFSESHGFDVWVNRAWSG